MKLIMKMATTFASVCRVPGSNLETSHRIIPNLHHKVGDAVLVLLINKTRQKPRLSKFTKLAQGSHKIANNRARNQSKLVPLLAFSPYPH